MAKKTPVKRSAGQKRTRTAPPHDKEAVRQRPGAGRGRGGSFAVFPGSFDPLTIGHVDIVERALEVFDGVAVGVLWNESKKVLFTPDERVELIRAQFKSYGDRVHVESFKGLLVDFVRRQGSRVIIRGLRAISDFDYEAQMALINRKLSPEIETFFMTAREENAYISSSVVKQVALLGGDVTAMVPPVVARALAAKYRERQGLS